MLLLNTPADVMDMAVEYLNIYFLGLPFLFMYNVLSSMFNALGKSRIPLYFLIFSSLFNIVLDVISVTWLNMGVAGVAWATLIAQGISAVLSFIVFMRLMRQLSRSPRASLTARAPFHDKNRPALHPPAVHGIHGMMLVQSVVNSFGSQALRASPQACALSPSAWCP